jgi:hypothetical protein
LGSEITEATDQGASSFLCGKGFFAFLFEFKEDRDLIFRSGQYFLGARGLYLNKWSLDFNPENDIPSAVPMWFKLPHFPLHCWRDVSLRCIINTLGKYIDIAEPRENIFSCTRIYVEVELKKGLLKVVMISLDNWKHLQQLDFEQLPFKCKVCHEYKHFAKYCKKANSLANTNSVGEDKWKEVPKKSENGPI